MSRMVKDFVEIKDCTSLDSLIEQLIAIRDSLPVAAEPELKMRGDDFFGRRLTIAHFRPQTAEEVECDARYAKAYRESRERELARSATETDVGAERLRAVA